MIEDAIILVERERCAQIAERAPLAADTHTGTRQRDLRKRIAAGIRERCIRCGKGLSLFHDEGCVHWKIVMGGGASPVTQKHCRVIP